MKKQHEPVKRKDGSNYVSAPGPDKNLIPRQGFGGKFIRKQLAPKLVGPVYTQGQLETLIRELTVKGRTIPNFVLITRGDNKDKYRECIGTKTIHHYSS